MVNHRDLTICDSEEAERIERQMMFSSMGLVWGMTIFNVLNFVAVLTHEEWYFERGLYAALTWSSLTLLWSLYAEYQLQRIQKKYVLPAIEELALVLESDEHWDFQIIDSFDDQHGAEKAFWSEENLVLLFEAREDWVYSLTSNKKEKLSKKITIYWKNKKEFQLEKRHSGNYRVRKNIKNIKMKK